MFKVARWRSEKNKIKAVFKFQFQATQVPRAGWEMIMVTLVPVDTGRPTAKSEKVAVIDGTCRWANPIYETVILVRDPRTGRINEKVYRFLVSTTGSTKAEVLGEVTINIAEYAEVFKPSSVSLPLKASNIGAILHVTVHRLQGDGKGSESGDTAVGQHQKTLLSQLSKCDEEEVTNAIDGTKGIKSVEGDLSNKQTGNEPEDEKVIPANIESFNIAQVQKGKHYSKNLKSVSTNNVKNNEHHDQYPRIGDEICMHEINGASKEPVRSNNGANSEIEGSFVSCTCDRHKIAETLSEIAALRKRNQLMEAELKEMQERYSEISLKFAEVEGERQQLVKTIRTLKNALKN